MQPGGARPQAYQLFWIASALMSVSAMNMTATSRLSARYFGIGNRVIHQLCPVVSGIKQLKSKVFRSQAKFSRVEGNRLNLWRVGLGGTTVAPRRSRSIQEEQS